MEGGRIGEVHKGHLKREGETERLEEDKQQGNCMGGGIEVKNQNKHSRVSRVHVV